MDIARRYAVDLMKQVANLAGGIKAMTPEQQKELALFEIKAMVDPKVWLEIAPQVHQMLDVGLKAGNLDQMVDRAKELAFRAQRDFEYEQGQEENLKRRLESKLDISPEARQLLMERQQQVQA